MLGPIFEVPEEQRYWVVRSDAGYFAPHFLSNGVVAIGHLDELPLNDAVETVKLHPTLAKMSIHQRYPNLSDRQLGILWNQVDRFITEMVPGDIVITLSNQAIHVGRIQSNAFISKRPLFAPINHDLPLDPLTYKVRRAVAWGPSIPRRLVANLPIFRSLQANQTVFSVDKRRSEVNHLLWPIFVDRGALHFSVNISAEEGIDNLSVAYLQEMLSMAEAISRVGVAINGDAGQWFEDRFDELFLQMYLEDELQLRAKANYWSPGSIWGSIENIPHKEFILLFYVGYSAIFGSKLIGWDGLIDIETKKKIFAAMVKKFETRREVVKRKLKARPPSANNVQLTDASGDEPADPRSKQLELKLEPPDGPT